MFNSMVDKYNYELCMSALKEENQEIKRVLQSKEFKTGRYLSEFKKGISSISEFRKYLEIVRGKFRWKKLCKHYPIHHSENEMMAPANYYSDYRFVVYTCIFGAYDTPQEPCFCPDNCDFVIITDQEVDSNSLWREKSVESLIPDYEKLTNAEKNRFCKMMPHILFPEYTYSVYIDGNIKPISDLTEFINRCNSTGMALHLHKSRTCVYEEIEACKILRKASTTALDNFRKYLEDQRFPYDYGMNECNVIVRKHNDPTIISIMSKWWGIFRSNDVKRDQLSFPYVLYKHGLSPYDLGCLGNNVQDNSAIRVTVHK